MNNVFKPASQLGTTNWASLVKLSQPMQKTNHLYRVSEKNSLKRRDNVNTRKHRVEELFLHRINNEEKSIYSFLYFLNLKQFFIFITLIIIVILLLSLLLSLISLVGGNNGNSSSSTNSGIVIIISIIVKIIIIKIFIIITILLLVLLFSYFLTCLLLFPGFYFHCH